MTVETLFSEDALWLRRWLWRANLRKSDGRSVPLWPGSLSFSSGSVLDDEGSRREDLDVSAFQPFPPEKMSSMHSSAGS